MSKIYKVVMSILFLFSLSSCTSLGEVDPKKEINLTGTGKARITGESEDKKTVWASDKKIFITSLDGKLFRRMGLDSDFPASLLIDPGKHEIGIRYIAGPLFSDAVLWLNAEPEKSYIIKKKTAGYSVSFWLEDMNTGKKVGSVFGEDDSQKAK